MSSFTAYVILLFCISLALYFVGYTSPLLQYYNCQGQNSLSGTDIVQGSGHAIQNCPGVANGTQSAGIANAFINDTTGLILIGFVALIASGIISNLLGQGYSAIYIIPLLILMAVLNLVVFPMSFITQSAMPDILKIILIVFFNLLTVLAIISFVRGGD